MQNSPINFLQKLRQRLPAQNEKTSSNLLNWLEILVIILWAMWVAAPYLDTSTFLWPAGTGLGSKLLGHHFWDTFRQCGACALWNGTHNGGRPALADVFGSQFHPLVIITTLIWGVVGGAKIAIIAIMALTGIAQWWLAKLLKLGRLPAVWSAMIAVAAGHLATKNNEGMFGLMLSTAACSLAIAAILSLAINRRRRDTIILAIMGTLVLLSGQGYMQLALIAWAPAMLFLVSESAGGKNFFREVVLAVVIAVLIMGFILIPNLHFWPNFTKDTADLAFSFSQPLEYQPLNLVIRDLVFYNTADVLGKMPNAELQFVGWIPVIFALLSLRFVKKENFPFLAFLASGAFLSFFLASAVPLRFLSQWFPFFLGFRFTPPMAGLAVPAVLALAAFSLDKILNFDLPKIELALTTSTQKTGWSFSLKWLFAIALFVSIQQVYAFSKAFIGLQDMIDVYQSLEVFKTEQTEWISPPVGESFWMEASLYHGLKITNVLYSGANWAGRELPGPYLAAVREGQYPDSELVGDLAQIPLYRLPANEYATIQTTDGQIVPCRGFATGGKIEVECPSTPGGTLIVKEYSFDGWVVTRDGEQGSQPLLNSPWLSTEALDGEHIYHFNYRPSDVTWGFLLTAIGILLCIVLWIRPKTF